MKYLANNLWIRKIKLFDLVKHLQNYRSISSVKYFTPDNLIQKISDRFIGKKIQIFWTKAGTYYGEHGLCYR